MLRLAEIRHVLIHNAWIVDAAFLSRLPDWPQSAGQRIQVGLDTALGFLDLLGTLASALG